MGNGKSRYSDTNSDYLYIGQLYVEHNEWIRNDVSNFDEVELTIKRELDSQKSSLDDDLVNSVSRTGVKVDPSSTTYRDMFGRTQNRKGYPSTSTNVSKENIQKARNVSLQYASRVFETLNKLGFNLGGEEIGLNFTSTQGNCFGVFSNYKKYRSGVIRGDVNVCGGTIFRKHEFNDKWSISMSVGLPEVSMPITTLHEMGHLFDRLLSKSSDGRFSDTIKGKLAVSTYGNSDYQEAFAESFAMYTLGLNSSGKSDYHRNFVKTMEDRGYSSLYGSALKASVPKVSGVAKVSSTSTVSSIPKTTVTPKVQKPATSTTTKVRTASNFTKSSTSISGTIRGKNFSATITEGIRNRGYIERTVGSTKYRIDINTGAFTKID